MTETLTSNVIQAYVPPEIPNKYDIIPIHNSDRASFKKCRRYWEWSSPAKHNLMLRADIHGINKPMWFGTGIHYALEQYYTPGLRRDPVEAFSTWFDIQWNGGTVTEYWLDKVHDLKPKPVNQVHFSDDALMHESNDLWTVRGLENILPDPDHGEFMELKHLGTEMMRFYKTYAEKNDDFYVLMTEHDFSVPIWDYENNKLLRAVDTREESPNYGKLLEVHARGRMDAIKQSKLNGKLGIIDHKTAEKIGEDYFTKLETDEQCTSYLWAAEIEAKYYDLPHKGEPLEEVIYNTLRKYYPKEPTEVRGGMFSINRETESATYDMLMEWIKRNAPGVPLTEKQQGYVDWLKEVGDEQFIIRKMVLRNRHQLANAGKRLYLETMDMLDPNIRIYPNLRNDFTCLNCQFRAPCLAKEDGSDWKQLIHDNYTMTKDR
jgi:hypothetical protein